MTKVPENDFEPSSHALDSHQDYVAAIGMISLEVVALELRLALLLARTLSIPVRTAQAIYLTPKAEQTRIDILRNVAHAALSVTASKKSSSLGRQKLRALGDINEILNRAERLIRDRHRVIHDEWNYSDSEKVVTRKLIDGRQGREVVPIHIEKLNALIRDIRLLIDDVYALSKCFKASPPTMASVKLK